MKQKARIITSTTFQSCRSEVGKISVLSDLKNLEKRGNLKQTSKGQGMFKITVSKSGGNLWILNEKSVNWCRLQILAAVSYIQSAQTISHWWGFSKTKTKCWRISHGLVHWDRSRLKFVVRQGSVYIGSQSHVVRMPVEHCDTYKSCRWVNNRIKLLFCIVSQSALALEHWYIWDALSYQISRYKWCI